MFVKGSNLLFYLKHIKEITMKKKLLCEEHIDISTYKSEICKEFT